jgi:hypothetical protein
MFFYVFFLGFGVGFFYFELWVVYHVFSYFFGFLGFWVSDISDEMSVRCAPLLKVPDHRRHVLRGAQMNN